MKKFCEAPNVSRPGKIYTQLMQLISLWSAGAAFYKCVKDLENGVFH